MKNTYIKIKEIPSLVFNSLSLLMKVIKIVVAKSKNAAEMINGIVSVFIGDIIATIPITNPILVSTPPVKSPITISLFLIFIALMPKVNSGSVVASESRNNPTII